MHRRVSNGRSQETVEGTEQETHLVGCAVGRTCMKLADLGSCGGLLDTREEARPSVGMFRISDCPVRCETERPIRLWPLLSTGLPGLLGRLNSPFAEQLQHSDSGSVQRELVFTHRTAKHSNVQMSIMQSLASCRWTYRLESPCY